MFHPFRFQVTSFWVSDSIIPSLRLHPFKFQVPSSIHSDFGSHPFKFEVLSFRVKVGILYINSPPLDCESLGLLLLFFWDMCHLGGRPHVTFSTLIFCLLPFDKNKFQPKKLIGCKMNFGICWHMKILGRKVNFGIGNFLAKKWISA